jgi:uncharacterized protein with PIN domain
MEAGSCGKRGFVVDEMLWKLGRFLRIAGFEVSIPRPTDDNELARISIEENKILLTRDRDLSSRKDACSFRIYSDNIILQLRELKEGLDLDDLPREGSNCPACGHYLVIIPGNDLDKRIESGIPPKVRLKQDPIYFCEKCGKVYWRGKHWEGIARILGEYDLLPDI